MDLTFSQQPFLLYHCQVKQEGRHFGHDVRSMAGCWVSRLYAEDRLQVERPSSLKSVGWGWCSSLWTHWILSGLRFQCTFHSICSNIIWFLSGVGIQPKCDGTWEDSPGLSLSLPYNLLIMAGLICCTMHQSEYDGDR